MQSHPDFVELLHRLAHFLLDRIHRQSCRVVNMNPFWTLAGGVAKQQLVAFHFEGEIGGGQVGFRRKLEREGGLAHAGASADEVERAGPVEGGQLGQDALVLFDCHTLEFFGKNSVCRPVI